jgi:hypothetical protein
MDTDPFEFADDDLAVEQPATHGSRRRRWTSPGGRTSVTVHVDAGLAILTVTGSLTGRPGLVCRTALEAAIGARVPRVVLDLRAAVIKPESRPVLQILEAEAARHGVSVWLVGLSVPSRIILLRGDPSARHRTFDTVADAVEAGGAPPASCRLRSPEKTSSERTK